jgi:hypothetical protein
MIEALNDNGRPFHQRATEMVIPPLNPARSSAVNSRDTRRRAFVSKSSMLIVASQIRQVLSREADAIRPPSGDHDTLRTSFTWRPTASLSMSQIRTVRSREPVASRRLSGAYARRNATRKARPSVTGTGSPTPVPPSLNWTVPTGCQHHAHTSSCQTVSQVWNGPDMANLQRQLLQQSVVPLRRCGGRRTAFLHQLAKGWLPTPQGTAIRQEAGPSCRRRLAGWTSRS